MPEHFLLGNDFDDRVNSMCRNIRTLYNFEPPATGEEIHASALQFVRKLKRLSPALESQ